MAERKISFESAYEKLEKAAAAVSDENTPLDKAIKSYKEGREYYEYCMSILSEARQIIEVYDKERGGTHPAE